ncbi:TetR/AcrR family transcriptional regulator [Dictyobacter aurantiacus]|uniref:TetR family transcriptional regulator n=1 Tax=Dictyobacter aurantiacus TaxID=1936993 RepID=A0A401ZSG2_9CHLR|nr:TetR/AcrR family transcriptional regulator [Dictyobacter aurantiacus]GCE09801.1 TetR family transcriptional regulator [Dictyobacter aurantiacus]
MHQNTKSPRSPKLDRRAELLKISREIMAEKGYEATTVSAIVARAGVAQGTFYWYFPSKASIVKALTVEMQDEVQAALTSAFMVSESLDRKIERSIRDIFGILSHYHDVLVLSRLIDSASGNEFVFAPYHRLIAELLHREQELGTITSSIDPEIAAELIVGTVYYANLQCYVYHSTLPVEKYIAGTSQFVRQALGLI